MNKYIKPKPESNSKKNKVLFLYKGYNPLTIWAFNCEQNPEETGIFHPI